MRHLGSLLALALLAGCTSPPSKVDLFYGPQLIPPPSTASNTVPTGGGQQPPPGDYYDQPPTGGTGTGTGTGSGGFPSGGGSTSGGEYAPPGGGYEYPGSTSSSRSGTGFQEVSNSTTTGGNATGSSAASASDPFSSYNNTSAPPRTFPDDGRVAPRNNVPQNNVPGTSGQTTPNAGGSTTGDRYQNYTPSDVQPDDQASTTPGRFVPPSQTRALSGSGVQPVSYSRVVTEANSDASATSRGSYDYDANYSWLRGQLDYSQSERRWKLRYIPITGETDNFGGSVILTGQNFDAFRSGEFVTVQGQLDDQEVEKGGFAPLYHVQQIMRVE